MKMKLKKLVRSAKCLVLSAALCAVGLAAWAEPDAVQLWKDGPYFATCNVGAEKPEEYGYYFWWGDTVGYTNNGATASAEKKWVSVADGTTSIKFTDEPPANTLYGADPAALADYVDANGNLKSDYDAAMAHLGAPWRMMTKDELDLLVDNCDVEWTDNWNNTGVKGRIVKGKGDYAANSVFFPASGYGYERFPSYAGEHGCYWTSTPESDDSDCASNFYFDESNFDTDDDERCLGMSVRAVRDTPPTPTPPEPSDEEVVATAEATFVLGPALAVANVTTATHWPWDGKIDVTCDLTGTGTVQLEAALTTNGVKVCDATAENVTGETTINLDAAGGVTNGVKFVWDAKADCPAGFNATDTKVKVTAKKVVPKPLGSVQLWKDGPYWATSNLGEPESHDPAHPQEYGALYKFADAAKAVTEALGTEWRVPSDGELKMLAGKNKDGAIVCSNVWTTCNGVAGRRFFGMTSGYEDKSIFLPAAGYDQGNGRESAGDNGRYWSSEPRVDLSAWYLFFDKSGIMVNGNNRSYGMPVRAVRDAK